MAEPDFSTQDQLFGTPRDFVSFPPAPEIKTEAVSNQAMQLLLELARKQASYQPPPPPQYQPPQEPAKRFPKFNRAVEALMAGFAAIGDQGAQQYLNRKLQQEQQRHQEAQMDYANRAKFWQDTISADTQSAAQQMQALQGIISAEHMLRPDYDAQLKKHELESIKPASAWGLTGYGDTPLTYTQAFGLLREQNDRLTEDKREANTHARSLELEKTRAGAVEKEARRQRIAHLQGVWRDLDARVRAKRRAEIALKAPESARASADEFDLYYTLENLRLGPITDEERARVWAEIGNNEAYGSYDAIRDELLAESKFVPASPDPADGEPSRYDAFVGGAAKSLSAVAGNTWGLTPPKTKRAQVASPQNRPSK